MITTTKITTIFQTNNTTSTPTKNNIVYIYKHTTQINIVT